MKQFAKIFNGFQLLTISAKRPILDVRQDSGYASGITSLYLKFQHKSFFVNHFQFHYQSTLYDPVSVSYKVLKTVLSYKNQSTDFTNFLWFIYWFLSEGNIVLIDYCIKIVTSLFFLIFVIKWKNFVYSVFF